MQKYDGDVPIGLKWADIAGVDLRGPRDVGNWLDRHAIVVSLKGRTQNRQLLMRLEYIEVLVGLDHAGRDPYARPCRYPGNVQRCA